MSTHDRREQSSEHIDNPDVAHEHSDVNVRGIFGFGIGLALGTALVSLLLWGAFSVMVDQFTPGPSPTASPLTRNRPVVPESQKHAESTFPEPRLQPNASEDLAKFRQEEHRRLNSYGWVDQNRGIAHIPIERAKQLVLERGLPVRAAGTAPPSAPPPAPPAATTGEPAPTAAEVTPQPAAQPKAQQRQQAPRRQQPRPRGQRR
jgi:hypothetical protein